jgi:hypothetical protein
LLLMFIIKLRAVTIHKMNQSKEVVR